MLSYAVLYLYFDIYFTDILNYRSHIHAVRHSECSCTVKWPDISYEGGGAGRTVTQSYNFYEGDGAGRIQWNAHTFLTKGWGRSYNETAMYISNEGDGVENTGCMHNKNRLENNKFKSNFVVLPELKE